MEFILGSVVSNLLEVRGRTTSPSRKTLLLAPGRPDVFIVWILGRTEKAVSLGRSLRVVDMQD